MARYRLPEALGGGEYEEYRHVDGGTEAPAGTVAFLEDGCIFTVARGLLTEVTPLPEEPPAFSVVQIGASFFEKRDDAGINWWDIAAQTWLTWEQICSIGTPVRLVPDPFAEPVELPWEIKDREGYVLGVYESQRPWAAARVGRGESGVDLTSGGCQEMALALMAAAAADKEQS